MEFSHSIARLPAKLTPATIFINQLSSRNNRKAYQMYEILNTHPITGKFTIYNIRAEVSCVSTCERRRIIHNFY